MIQISDFFLKTSFKILINGLVVGFFSAGFFGIDAESSAPKNGGIKKLSSLESKNSLGFSSDHFEFPEPAAQKSVIIRELKPRKFLSQFKKNWVAFGMTCLFSSAFFSGCGPKVNADKYFEYTNAGEMYVRIQESSEDRATLDQLLHSLTLDSIKTEGLSEKEIARVKVIENKIDNYLLTPLIRFQILSHESELITRRIDLWTKAVEQGLDYADFSAIAKIMNENSSFYSKYQSELDEASKLLIEGNRIFGRQSSTKHILVELTLLEKSFQTL